MNEQPNNPLHGITLEKLLTQLVDHYGWEELGRRIDIRCFNWEPSIKSSLKFLRKNQWARDEAEALLREVLDARRATMGEKHQATIGAMSHLGLLLKDRGDFKSSEALLREASTVMNENCKSSARRAQLERSMCRGLTLRWCDSMSCVCGFSDGPGHAESLICKGNLGGLLKEARNATAETVLREALSGMRKVLGEAHTATLTCSINLALVLVGKGAHAARAVQRSRDADPPGLCAARARRAF